MPFLPGGLEDAVVGAEEAEEGSEKQTGMLEALISPLTFTSFPCAPGLRTIPPGFSRGLRIPGEEEDEAGDNELLTSEPEVSAVPTAVNVSPCLLLGEPNRDSDICALQKAAEPRFNEPAELPIAAGDEFALDTLLPADVGLMSFPPFHTRSDQNFPAGFPLPRNPQKTASKAGHY